MDSIFSNYRPVRMILLFNLLAFTLLFLFEERYDQKILLSGLIVMALIYLSFTIIKWRTWGDEYLFLIVSMLASIGIMMIFRLEVQLGIKQIQWFMGGIVLFFISYIVYQKIRFWDRLTIFYLILSLTLFIITLAFGKKISGATNWVNIGGITLQPSEMIKVIFIFFIASFFKNRGSIKIPNLQIKGKKIKIKDTTVMTLIAYTHMGFLVIQREWGGALLFFLVYFTLLYIFESDLRLLLINAGIAIVGGLLGAKYVYHIQVRISTWLDPWRDISGKGYQITQSLFAIGSGGFFGTGIGLGSPQYIPEAQTDFIFSAICEELGIFGGAAVVLLYFILVYRGMKIAMKVDDTFHKAVALGITIMFGFQTFIIIGGVIKLIPLTGITLPFISYGGSSLTTSFVALGILQAISKNNFEEEEGEI